MLRLPDPTPGGAGAVPSGGVAARGGAAQLLVQPERLFELVLQDHDAARGLDRRPAVDELTGTGRDAQLVAGVAPVAALRPQG